MQTPSGWDLYFAHYRMIVKVVGRGTYSLTYNLNHSGGVLFHTYMKYSSSNTSFISRVCSNGLLDPWSSGGVLYNVSSSTVAVIIPEGAHHLDLRESNPADPVSVRTARKFHCKFIRLWLHNH